jgi:PKD repeat protein
MIKYFPGRDKKPTSGNLLYRNSVYISGLFNINQTAMKKFRFFLAFSLLFIAFAANSQDTIVFQPGPEGKDAYINDYYSNGYGDYPNLFAMANTSAGIPFRSRSVFEFDLSSIPAGVEIIEAKLSLYYANNPYNPHTHFGDNDTYLRRIVEPWDEHEVSWWNQPETTSQNEVILKESTSPTQDYEDIDVTAMVTDMIADSRNSHGFMMQLFTEVIMRRIMFASSDYTVASKRPKLVVVYQDCEPPTVSFNYLLEEMTVNFEPVCPTATSWLWDFGDGYLSTLEDPHHTYEAPGVYQVCLHVEDSCGTADYCEEIEVCQHAVPGFEFRNEYLTVYFTDVSLHTSIFFWEFGDGYYSDLQNPLHSYDSAGYYNVCLYIRNECGQEYICHEVYVCGPPPASWFSYTSEELTVNFLNLSQNSTGYAWDFGDDEFSEETSPVHTYDSSGYYNVCLRAGNDCGADSVCMMIYVEMSDIGEGFLPSFSIYPNPAVDNIHIDSGIEEEVEMRLLDVNGREMLKLEHDFRVGSHCALNISKLNAGIYFLKLTGDSFVVSRKILKFE